MKRAMRQAGGKFLYPDEAGIIAVGVPGFSPYSFVLYAHF